MEGAADASTKRRCDGGNGGIARDVSAPEWRFGEGSRGVEIAGNDRLRAQRMPCAPKRD